MRLIIDSLVALMLAGMVGGMVWHHRHTHDLEQRIDLTRQEVHRFQSQIDLQRALEKVPMSAHGHPAAVAPEWFDQSRPVNALLGEGHPWVEIAGESQRGLYHPRTRIATSHDTAQFWYNPYTGVIRARVPGDVSDATALRWYNRINGSHLTDLFARAD